MINETRVAEFIKNYIDTTMMEEVSFDESRAIRLVTERIKDAMLMAYVQGAFAAVDSLAIEQEQAST